MKPDVSERSFEEAIVNILVSRKPGGRSTERAAEPTLGYGEINYPAASGAECLPKGFKQGSRRSATSGQASPLHQFQNQEALK